MEWVENLYAETKEKWEKTGKDERGFAIFYSPLKKDAKIAIIGYNPGGGSESFAIEDVRMPSEHEYHTAKYPLAKKVCKIFSEAGLDIRETVKFNLIFFRSKKANEMNNRELIHFSEQKVMQILNQLRPKLIITEGFATFERLLQLKNGKKIYEEDLKGKCILLVGELESHTTILGMKHPTGARLSNEILSELGKKIKLFIGKL